MKPTEVRWNSLFNCVKRITELKGKLPELCHLVGVEQFQELELKFLDDYVTAMGPVAAALDKLQSENECYYGILAPTILKTVDRLDTIIFSSSCSTYAPLLAKYLKAGFENRFGWILRFTDDAKHCILASVSHPFFKLRWVPPAMQLNVREILMTEAMRHKYEAIHAVDNTCEEVLADDNFFGYDEEPGSSVHTTQNRAELEVLQYLEDSNRNLAMLEKYSVIRKIFLRFNTPLPSSAPVERLFSSAGQIMTPRRNRMSDSLFEQLTFLNCNRD